MKAWFALPIKMEERSVIKLYCLLIQTRRCMKIEVSFNYNYVVIKFGEILYSA